jgi:hypothetical protein
MSNSTSSTQRELTSCIHSMHKPLDDATRAASYFIWGQLDGASSAQLYGVVPPLGVERMCLIHAKHVKHLTDACG